MFATGVLITYVALTAFQRLRRDAHSMVSLASLTSIGWMAIVNFMIDSDFKWRRSYPILNHTSKLNS